MMYRFEKPPVIFCATQRSGSTMIYDDFLAAQRLASRESEMLHQLSKTRPSRDVLQNVIAEREQVEGLFSDKIMYHQIDAVSDMLDPGNDDRERAFHTAFQGATWVYIERIDIFSQAVSMMMAERTSLWNSWDGENVEKYNDYVPYDRVALRNYFVYFSEERQRWKNFFDRFQISPHRITYEEAVDRFENYLLPLFRECNIEKIEKAQARRINKLGNDLNVTYADALKNDLLFDLAIGNGDLWKDYTKINR